MSRLVLICARVVLDAYPFDTVMAAGVELFCASNKYDAILSLGSERREDSYSDKGSVLATPWTGWMAKHKHEYGYSSVITGDCSDRSFLS